MTWLDPSPLLPIFQQWAETFPIREPFISQRKQLRSGQPFELAAVSANEARHERVLAELRETGETHSERKLRRMREWHRAKKAALKAKKL